MIHHARAQPAWLFERLVAAGVAPDRSRAQLQALFDSMRDGDMFASGNFLYLALQCLKDIEHRLNLEAEALGPPRQIDVTGPHSARCWVRTARQRPDGRWRMRWWAIRCLSATR